MSAHYAIRHTTSFIYASPVSETVMELRMRPATAGPQRCLQFEVEVQPRARIFAYRDFLGNWVHHFDIPRRHPQLLIVARAQVQLDAPPALPEALPGEAWLTVDEWSARGDEWHFRQPSHFAAWTPRAAGLRRLDRRREPADTPIRSPPCAPPWPPFTAASSTPPTPRAWTRRSTMRSASRQGVCQDFAHLMIAALRHLGLPARYVSGYMAPNTMGDGPDPSSIATHAWVEVMLPELGWTGFDPTHNMEAGLRHVRVAIGRDYADVPPTRGTFKGKSASTLSVSVEVTPGEALPTLDPAVLQSAWSAEAAAPADDERDRQQQQQQQQ